MSKLYVGDAKESTSQTILGKVNTIDGKLSPVNLENVAVFVADFTSDELHIRKGGLNSSEQCITT